MSDTITHPGEVHELKVTLPSSPMAGMAQGTFVTSFQKIAHLLSDKTIRRPTRFSPIPDVTNESLKRLAEKHPPSAEWFEGEEDRPF